MRFFTTVVFAVLCGSSGVVANASVGWCFPLPWGAGYAPAPTYGAYYGGYAPDYGVSWSAGYAGCAPSCCPSACATDCVSGCGSGCGAACSQTISSDRVPGPVDDPGFREGDDRKPREEPDSEQDWRKYDRRDGDKARETDEQPPEPARRPRPKFLDEQQDDGDTGFRSRGGTLESRDDDENDFRSRGFGDEIKPEARDGADDFGGSTEDNAPPFDFGTRKPVQDPPVDEFNNSGVGDEVVPPPGADDETRLFRGVLSESQARTGQTDSTSRVKRLAQTIRRQSQVRSARWSARDSKQRRPLKWIAAPVSDGRIRL